MQPRRFQRIVRTAVKRYGGSKQAFAEAVGMAPSRLSGLLAGRGPVGVETCLRIARAGQLSAADVLRAAGKADVLALMVELFGEAAAARRLTDSAPRIRPVEVEFLRRYRQLSPVRRRILAELVWGMAEAPPLFEVVKVPRRVRTFGAVG